MSNDDVTEVCNVYITARARDTGDVVAMRAGHNVWTNAGREYSCLVKTLGPDGANALRDDRIAYIGVGVGNQPETVEVRGLVSPVAYLQGKFLKQINHALTTFPTTEMHTRVRYVCTFTESELTPSSGQPEYYSISECGLFTNGDQSTFRPGGRNISIAAAHAQSPVAYHAFDPIPKLNNLELEIIWELRH
jgi:hypothetical protein